MLLMIFARYKNMWHTFRLNLDGHRRSMCLVVLGILFIAYGFSLWHFIHFPLPLYRHLYMHPFAAGWIACGVLAMFGALPTLPRWVGYAAAPLMPLMWVVIYTGSVIFGTARGSVEGVVIWGALTALILIIAGWKESTHYRYRDFGVRVRDERKGDDPDGT